MPYTIRYNARTVHLEGLAERTTGPATDNSATTGVVAYYAQSACAALTRSGSRMGAYGDPIDSIALALDTFRDVAKWKGLKLCANCERAAVTALNRAYNAAHRNARDAAADLDRANSSDNESWQADAEQRSEQTYDTYVELAAAVGRCLIFGCDGEAEYRSHCPEHDTTDDIEDDATASAIEAETAARHEADNAARMIAAVEHDDAECPERTTVDGIDSPCVNVGEHVEHNTEHGAAWWTPAPHDARACPARALGEPCEHCEPLFTALEDARLSYRQAVDDADGSHDHITLALADAALTAYQAAARAAAACLYYGCAAVVDDGSGWCHEHGPKTVRFVNDDYDPAVAAAGRASTIGKPYTPTGESYSGCEARIYHNGVGSPCARPRGHEGRGTNGHRTTTGIEWMPGQTRPSYCPYARTTAGCDDCAEHGALVDRIMAGEFGGAKTYADAEALAVAIEREPEAFVSRGPDPEAAYNARRARYRYLADHHEEHGGEDNRAAAAAAWDAFVSAARAAGKCIDFTCYADAEPGADHCQRHHKRVTARLDHTEPGKAIALIEGGHGREAAPQAWLAHEGGSWLLVDDYDGDTLNVKGPDPDRAVHAWAALLGLRIDALTVEVEYAGGPVSPPVREPEDRAPVTLEWVLVGDDDGAPVFEARGRAHTYRVTKHASGYAPLVATLRGANVETHRRSYASVANARKAGQDYETRYATIYAPAE